jgi:hypothetical protein
MDFEVRSNKLQLTTRYSGKKTVLKTSNYWWIKVDDLPQPAKIKPTLQQQYHNITTTVVAIEVLALCLGISRKMLIHYLFYFR